MTRALAIAAGFGFGVYVGLALANVVERRRLDEDGHWQTVRQVTL